MQIQLSKARSKTMPLYLVIWNVFTFDLVVMCKALGITAEVSTFSTTEISRIGITTESSCRT